MKHNGDRAEKTQKLLVTGASGLLGNWIVALAENDFLVTPTDIIEPQHQKAVKSDITDGESIRHLFQK